MIWFVKNCAFMIYRNVIRYYQSFFLKPKCGTHLESCFVFQLKVESLQTQKSYVICKESHCMWYFLAICTFWYYNTATYYLYFSESTIRNSICKATSTQWPASLTWRTIRRGSVYWQPSRRELSPLLKVLYLLQMLAGVENWLAFVWNFCAHSNNMLFCWIGRNLLL